MFVAMHTIPVKSPKSQLTPVRLAAGFMSATRNSDNDNLGLKNNLRFLFSPPNSPVKQ